ncbi:MAG: hydrolase [Patescibacteria group bacterium]
MNRKDNKNLYFSHTTCPKCAEVYGKNYVILFAQINL